MSLRALQWTHWTLYKESIKYLMLHQHQEQESEKGGEREGASGQTTVILTSSRTLPLHKLKLNYSSRKNNKQPVQF